MSTKESETVESVGAAYSAAGVSIEAGNEVVSRIGAAVKSTNRPEVISGIGGFGGLFAMAGYSDPVLVSGADGVGTKLLVAERLGRHQSVGIDLVAMSVNDIIVSGAEPLFFLDYFATGKLEPDVAVAVVEGIAEGCRLSGCALLGGETAEMPGMYAPGHYDLAGFAVGVVERDQLLTGADITEGNLLIGIPSSGLHSNGFSLVRRLVGELDWDSEHGLGAPLGDILMTPTRIYVRDVLDNLSVIKGLVHVTGGGFYENIPRVMPDGLGVSIDLSTWDVPPIFTMLARLGDLSQRDMYTTFNMGIGMIAVVDETDAKGFTQNVEGAVVIGRVTNHTGVELR
jgi:phosphoribosylformylglycinamidine cyclo-ligase